MGVNRSATLAALLAGILIGAIAAGLGHKDLPVDRVFHYSRIMESKAAITALSALGQEARLNVFRLLIKAGPDGMPAGRIAEALSVPPNTLSANLSILSHAGLIASRRAGRSVIYAADLGQMRALIGFLIQDCCNGAPELCAPLADLLAEAECCDGC